VKDNSIIIRHGQTGQWLHFANPVRLLIARQKDQVIPCLLEIEEAVQNNGLYAAGFISYEAAPAFDAALPATEDSAFPLLWLGLFRQPTFADSLPLTAAGEQPLLSWQPSISREEYSRCIKAIHGHIRNGDTYQVNFSYRLRTTTTADPWDLFCQIVQCHNPVYAAFIDTGEWAICSASPELFFRLEDERIESRPMKGTAPRGLWHADDCQKASTLHDSEKDRAENVMIVDMARNDLGRIARIDSVRVPELFTVEKHSTVWQMTSTVNAETDASLVQILQALFPPASITGAPKRRTMEIIAELELSPRRIYTGAIGYLAPGRQAQFNVAIRTLLVDKRNGQAEYGVGGGIVWDSRDELEFKESQVKARILQIRRPDFDLLETMLWSPGEGFFLLEYHLTRLSQSAEYFEFTIDLARVSEELHNAFSHLPKASHRIRLLVTRKGAVRCEASRIESRPSFPDITLASAPVDSTDIFLYHKTTNRTVYENILKERPGHTDVLLFNEKGEVTETTIANVAVKIDGQLYTPPLSCGLLPGTCRAWMLDSNQMTERIITIEQVLSSNSVYLMNSVRGMHRVNVLCPDERIISEAQST
jgi:para-aminobenzoate synthetase/4-amino-4-deoxychorismate lyase